MWYRLGTAQVSANSVVCLLIYIAAHVCLQAAIYFICCDDSSQPGLVLMVSGQTVVLGHEWVGAVTCGDFAVACNCRRGWLSSGSLLLPRIPRRCQERLLLQQHIQLSVCLLCIHYRINRSYHDTLPAFPPPPAPPNAHKPTPTALFRRAQAQASASVSCSC